MLSDEILQSSKMLPLAGSESCHVYQSRNETGEGTMTIYDLFPGVMLAYNDYHMAHFDSEFISGDDLFCIDHCREGRLEYPAPRHAGSAYGYVAAGDLKLDRRLQHTGHFEFPLRHYHGITIGLTLPQGAKALPEAFRDFPVDLYRLKEKYCADGLPRVLHGAPSIDHIFAELYAVPERIKMPYFKLKVLELLLYLDALELPKTPEEPAYFYRGQVEKVKAIERMMTAHPEHRYTLEELAERYDLPLTALKACFKSVFGSPVNAYMRVYRMNLAAPLLRGRGANVAEIAGRVGYDSPSKFAAAFRDVMGVTPTEYRKNL